MLKDLLAFKRKHGHCSVPTRCPENPALGRWVAAQRYNRRIDNLSKSQIRELDRIGFVWSSGDHSWNKAFQVLQTFKKKHGHCDVPRDWPQRQTLANWVHNQRHKRRKGKLSAEKTRKLDGLGFCWSIYKDGSGSGIRARQKQKTRGKKRPPAEERLYFIGPRRFIQYGGNGRMPAELGLYVANHKGQFPPYIPLPTTRIYFYLGERYISEKKIIWSGRGPLPEKILDYVIENGTLPPHD